MPTSRCNILLKVANGLVITGYLVFIQVQVSTSDRWSAFCWRRLPNDSAGFDEDDGGCC